jgi:hypothetical protein
MEAASAVHLEALWVPRLARLLAALTAAQALGGGV